MDRALAAGIRARDRERWLSVLWAPAAARGALVALHAFDLEQQRIIADAGEPLLAEIRLAWWREQIDALVRTGAAPGQPILHALAAEAAPRGVDLVLLTLMEEGFLPLLLDGSADTGAMARARGAPLFTALFQAIAARPLSAAEATAAALGGAIWAFGRLLRGPWGPAGARLSGMEIPPPPAEVPRPLPAPLRGLVRLAIDDWAAAAAGRAAPPPATFGRQWRFASSSLRR